MTQPPAPDWAARLALSVAREVRRHRQAQGLSAQQLADRCARIGMPIQRSVLANLESGRRTTVNLAEVLVLATALQVPPGVLIFPVGYEQQAEVLPGAFIEPASAVEWLSGRTLFSDEAAEDFFETPLGLIRLHQDAATALRRAIQTRDHAVRELTRAQKQHSDDARAFETLTVESERVRQRLDELAAAAERGDEYDFREVERLSELHRQLVERSAAVQGGAGALAYAQQRAASTQEALRARENALREIREKIKGQGLATPFLPRMLIYIDPESTPAEDVPVKKGPASEGFPEGVLESGTPAPEEAIQGDNVALILASSEADKERIRELLDELQPRLAETINAAIEEAFRRREKEGE